VGGVLPFVMIPVLALWLPESTSLRVTRSNPVAALFRDRLASSTVLLWAMNFLSLLAVYLILLWTPSILHITGVSTSRAILSTSIYGIGTILGPLLTASVIDRGAERILTYTTAFGAVCVLAIGLFDMQFGLFSIVIFAAGMGMGSCQGGLNSLSGKIYPSTIRSTGAGWALGPGAGWWYCWACYRWLAAGARIWSPWYVHCGSHPDSHRNPADGDPRTIAAQRVNYSSISEVGPKVRHNPTSATGNSRPRRCRVCSGGRR
jgi:predicted MFS family arabinose efflux permease